MKKAATENFFPILYWGLVFLHILLYSSINLSGYQVPNKNININYIYTNMKIIYKNIYNYTKIDYKYLIV